ncbi:hypothetical protein TW81_15645 [Vibrio galatheae]|uniref:Uncharacterized protein n=1 Tax=Vibrio galatheae TaxID=579748 RepID=A0A0F4NFR3_9VIBR|nr:hypothetical protein [Vibrio galatheae]KJY81789.1 hypothetical protein TW81_15645 [Vibrio galatheae]
MHKSALSLVALFFITFGPTLSWACSYDGQFNNPFTESYPGSLGVAISTQQAIRSQAIERPDSLLGPSGLRRASWWLKVLVDLSPDIPEETYIYLVDSQLWSLHQGGSQIAIHVDAPTSSEKILLISEAALHNVVSKHITLDTALKLGIAQQL